MGIAHLGVLRFAVVAFLCLAGSAIAEPLAPSQAGSPSATSNPIVVTAELPTTEGEKPSAWKRAATPNVAVYSDGSAEQLTRVTQNLDMLHDLLAKLYHSRGHGDEPPPLTVVLFDSPTQMRKLGLRNSRFEEGPFAKPFAEQRYYDPREDGSMLAVARLDQNSEMNTAKRAPPIARIRQRLAMIVWAQRHIILPSGALGRPCFMVRTLSI